jgi:signal transduction histidine kinase
MRSTIPQRHPISVCLPTRRHLVIVTVFTLLLSLPLQGISGSPYLDVFGRVGCIGAMLLVAYSAAGELRPRWLAPSLARLGAIVLAAPIAALTTVLVAERGNVLAYLRQPQSQTAYIAMVLMAVLFGVPFSLLAMRGERRQRERADRLQIELEKNRLERELLDVRLRILHAQIEPHFLFNTLANIEALVVSGSANAAPVLRHLIAYLRAAMPRLNDVDATLETEFQLVRSYLELMRLRMPDRLRFTVSAPPGTMTIRFPSMALLTLVENAVRHGIDPSVDGGEIEVGGYYDAPTFTMVLWVSDTGVGMSETAQPGTGLSNLRGRLNGFYGATARVDLSEAMPQGVRVELRFQPKDLA